MDSKRYAQLKDFVIGLNDIELHNLFEILTDEMNYRKIEPQKADAN